MKIQLLKNSSMYGTYGIVSYDIVCMVCMVPYHIVWYDTIRYGTYLVLYGTIPYVQYGIPYYVWYHTIHMVW